MGSCEGRRATRGWAQRLTLPAGGKGGGPKGGDTLISYEKVGFLLPEQKPPQGPPLASGPAHCLSSLADLAPERCGSPLGGASQSSAPTSVAKSAQKITRTSPVYLVLTMCY